MLSPWTRTAAGCHPGWVLPVRRTRGGSRRTSPRPSRKRGGGSSPRGWAGTGGRFASPACPDAAAAAFPRHAPATGLPVSRNRIRFAPQPARGAERGGGGGAESPADGHEGGRGRGRHVPLDRADRGGGHAALFRNLLEGQVLPFPDALDPLSDVDGFHGSHPLLL